MDRCIDILLHQTFAEQDGILEVITFPGHETDQRVLAQCQLSAKCRRTVSQDIAGLDAVALEDDRALVVAGTLVAADKFLQCIGVTIAIILNDHHLVGSRTLYDTAGFCDHADT